MKRCLLCGHGVANGNRHAKFTCPPAAGKGKGTHGKKKGAPNHLSVVLFNTRGASVPGIHKLSASSKQTK